MEAWSVGHVYTELVLRIPLLLWSNAIMTATNWTMAIVCVFFFAVSVHLNTTYNHLEEKYHYQAQLLTEVEMVVDKYVGECL